MSVGQAIVIVALLATMYGADPVQMNCMVKGESDYDAQAVNGDHLGWSQYRHPAEGESIWTLLSGMAMRDSAFAHAEYVRAHDDPHDPIAAAAVMAWAIAHGYGEWWSTFKMCEEGQYAR